MPPACRNHRAPTAGDTPAPTAESSLERPAAINAQNWSRSSRRATEGRPGDRNAPRPDRSERRPCPIATSSIEVLRRPLESAGRDSVAMPCRSAYQPVAPLTAADTLALAELNEAVMRSNADTGR